MSLSAATRKYLPSVRTGRWFQSIPEHLQEALMASAALRVLESNQQLFVRGDPYDGLYCVVEGAIHVSGVSESGEEALFVLMEAPNWFGEIAMFDGESRTHDAWAESPAKLLHVSGKALDELLTHHPQYWRPLGCLLAQKLRTAFMVMEGMAMLSASGRLAQRLVTIAEGYGALHGASRRAIHVPQEQLASMLALSRQTVNQILKQLAQGGSIRLVRGGVEILDIVKLRDAAK